MRYLYVVMCIKKVKLINRVNYLMLMRFEFKLKVWVFFIKKNNNCGVD